MFIAACTINIFSSWNVFIHLRDIRLHFRNRKLL